jgi:hypothetical protein
MDDPQAKRMMLVMAEGYEAHAMWLARSGLPGGSEAHPAVGWPGANGSDTDRHLRSQTASDR